jgi:hypothetical protein
MHPGEAGVERDHLGKALQETPRSYEKPALIGVSLALMSALPPKADMDRHSHVRFVQKARKLTERHGIQFLIGDGRRIGADLTGVPGRRFYFGSTTSRPYRNLEA